MIFYSRGEVMPKLGQFIKEKREEAGLSQKKLGVACGVSDSEIFKIETGVRKNPSWITLCEISKALSFHPFELLLIAGYISESDIHPSLRIHGLEDLNKNELNDVQQYIDFLISKRESKDKLPEEV